MAASLVSAIAEAAKRGELQPNAPRRTRGGRPVLGAVSGLLLGGFVALDLQQFAVRPFDNLSVIGLPALGLVVGGVFGGFHPLRRH